MSHFNPDDRSPSRSRSPGVKKASALLRVAPLQIGDANHPGTDLVLDLAIEAATAMTIVGDLLDHRHRGVADQPTEIGIVRAIVHPDTVGAEATVAVAALVGVDSLTTRRKAEKS
ncbi:hypothetical protein KXV20_000204 [Aspergillus fumigatus]|nr:hypothetical protein KXV20_000204 [Aspergillus fumigatus]